MFLVKQKIMFTGLVELAVAGKRARLRPWPFQIEMTRRFVPLKNCGEFLHLSVRVNHVVMKVAEIIVVDLVLDLEHAEMLDLELGQDMIIEVQERKVRL